MPTSPLSKLLRRLRGRAPDPASIADTPMRPQALPAGTVLGGARIERPIARGATAVLYAATNVVKGTPLAVKVLCPADGPRPAHHREACARFLQQAQNASRLDHPGIVRVYGTGQLQGLAYMVMELLPGADLTRHTRRTDTLARAVVLDIAARLAEALAYGHRQGVVHRDVKPANVMFDPASKTVKLTDFGLARASDAEASRSGVFMGSPLYMAPELLAGQPPDARSDLYALGVLTYELLAGRPPFEAASMGALLRAVAQSPPPPLATLRPDLAAPAAEQLDALLAPLLAKQPAQRPTDGEAWAAQARQTAQWLMSAANATNAR